jgi:hypothetical protein
MKLALTKNAFIKLKLRNLGRRKNDAQDQHCGDNIPN